MRLRRAQQENRLDRELASIGKARLLIIDEFGYLPIDEEGSRLLFQIISDSYETRSIIYTTNIEFSGWGRVLGDKNMAAASSTAPSTTDGSSDSRAAPTEANTPHDQITNTTQTGSGRYRTPCGKPAAYTAEKHRSQSGRQLAKTHPTPYHPASCRKAASRGRPAGRRHAFGPAWAPCPQRAVRALPTLRAGGRPAVLPHRPAAHRAQSGPFRFRPHTPIEQAGDGRNNGLAGSSDRCNI